MVSELWARFLRGLSALYYLLSGFSVYEPYTNPKLKEFVGQTCGGGGFLSIAWSVFLAGWRYGVRKEQVQAFVGAIQVGQEVPSQLTLATPEDDQQEISLGELLEKVEEKDLPLVLNFGSIT
ncbi:hypothetical protein QOT17_025336 [Balamuthia mandrillaris]